MDVYKKGTWNYPTRKLGQSCPRYEIRIPLTKTPRTTSLVTGTIAPAQELLWEKNPLSMVNNGCGRTYPYIGYYNGQSCKCWF